MFFMNKLILAEKTGTARILAHVVGAREKIYNGNSNAYGYFGNGYYVVNARGHLYGLGEPEDYCFENCNSNVWWVDYQTIRMKIYSAHISEIM